jgi:hypothetical protein
MRLPQGIQNLVVQGDTLGQATPSMAGGGGIRVQAQGMMDMGMGGNSQFVPLLYLDPLFDPILVVFPQDNIRELNRRERHYYKYQPYVRGSIDFHTETPLSDFDLRCPRHPEAQAYFNAFKRRTNLFDHIINVTRDYWLLGEGFLYGNWDDTTNEFSSFVQFPPEEVEIHSAYVSPERVYVLRPNRELDKLQTSANPADRMLQELMQTYSPGYAQALRENKPFILDSNRLVVLQRTMSGYSNRGVSPLMAALKDLLYEDYLNLFRMVFIQRHSFPLKIFKIGSVERGFIPPARFYTEFRRLLSQAANDPNFNIVTHPFVNVEVITGHDKILPLQPMYDLVKSRILTALFVSEAVISGEKTPFASGITFMRGLMQKYLTYRNNLGNELNRKVFSNLSRMRGFYYPTPAEVAHRVVTRREDNLVVPDISWQKANLLGNQQIMQMLLTLREKKDAPLKYVMEMFGFDFDDALAQMEREEGTRADPVYQEVRRRLATGDKKSVISDMGRRLLMGEKIADALRENMGDEIKTPEERGAEKAKEEFKPPEVAGEKPGIEPPAAFRPPEATTKPAAPGEGAGEATPRPEGETTPGAEAV